MTDQTAHITIDPDRTLMPIEDYAFLRKEGLNIIREIGSKLWTDHNIHDPGITILELLCYAITDLGYRMNLPLKDLLTAPEGKNPVTKDTFHLANEILPSHPVTITDYRKLLIDLTPGLKNVWLEKVDKSFPEIFFNTKTKQHSLFQPSDTFEKVQIKGLYRIIAELDDYETIITFHKAFLRKLTAFRPDTSSSSAEIVDKSEYQACYKNYLATVYAAFRNIGEDLYEVIFLKDEWVGICANIELHPQANAQTVLIQIYSLIYNHINPSINLYSWEELVAKEKKIEEIFEGPLPTRGFTDNDELKKFQRKISIYTSDLINIISDIEGVKSIREITLNSYSLDSGSGNTWKPIRLSERFRLNLKDEATSGFKFLLDYNKPSGQKLNRFNFFKGNIFFTIKLSSGIAIRNAIKQKTPENFSVSLPLPESKNRNLSQYFSIQNDFPNAYYLGKEGIPKSASDLRKAQRLQLKGYLLFFEQLLADYFEQLDKVKTIFSWKESSWDATYYHKQLSDKEIKDFDQIFKSADYQKYKGIIENSTERKERRNRLLDHLLARFGEQFVDYSLIKFRQNEKGVSYRSFSGAEKIHDKNRLLDSYPEISGHRSHALNYLELSNEKNRTTLEKRLLRIFGIDNEQTRLIEPVLDENGNIVIEGGKKCFYDNRFEPFDKTFGFHIIEHLLLRPLVKHPDIKLLSICGGATAQYCHCKDPFSMQITLIVPGWLAISNKMEFRRFVEEKIRIEAPAHMALKICWINPIQMFNFEVTFQQYLSQYRKIRQPKLTDINALIPDYIETNNRLVAVMSELKNIHPPSQLISCLEIEFDEYGNPIDTPVILNSSTLAEGIDTEYLLKKKTIN